VVISRARDVPALPRKAVDGPAYAYWQSAGSRRGRELVARPELRPLQDRGDADASHQEDLQADRALPGNSRAPGADAARLRRRDRRLLAPREALRGVLHPAQ